VSPQAQQSRQNSGFTGPSKQSEETVIEDDEQVKQESSTAESSTMPIPTTNTTTTTTTTTIATDPTDITLQITQTPRATEDMVDPRDSRYFHFFLSTMSYILPYTSIFPSIVHDVFARCVMHIALRHSVLSISSMIADYRAKRPMDRFHFQYIKSLQKIQHAIQIMSLDEGITIAVFLILWIDVVRAELRPSRKHLRGLYLLFQELQKRYRDPSASAALSQDPQILVDERGSTVGVSLLIMQIWRIALRLDFTTSLYLVQPPVFPAIPAETQDLHRGWIRQSTPDDDSTEWALAAFALDNLMHRACHVAYQARMTRRSMTYNPDAEFQIQYATNELAHQNREWFQRIIVRIAEAREQAAQIEDEVNPNIPLTPTTTDFPRTFLDFPRRRVMNPFYANLVMFAHATSIYISLIAHPEIGPGPDPQRYDNAVEICKLLAALGEDRSNTASSKIWIMFLAGAGFGGLRRSSKETEFLKIRLASIVKIFPLMKDAVAAYQTLWECEGDFWDAMDRVQEALY